MNLTKYEHACFTIEINGQFLVIDPGSFTHDLPLLTNVAGIVITHEHADHFNPDALAVLYGNNPDSILISLHEIIQKMPDHKSQAVTAGDVFSVGPFNLEFFGGTHAVIDPSMDTVGNLGVMINETLYYPGDSFTLPNKPVEVLALPICAPWLKLSETVAFLRSIHPKLAFPTHDAILSEIGKDVSDSIIAKTMEPYDGQYKRLTESLELRDNSL